MAGLVMTEIHQNTLTGRGGRDASRWAAGVVMLAVCLNVMAGGDRRSAIHYTLCKVAAPL